jgi:RND family efflux transporter MFP subunit
VLLLSLGLATVTGPTGGAAGPSQREGGGPYLGVLFVERSVDLAAPASGKVSAVLVRLGESTRRGEAVVRFDEAEARQQLARAQAEVDGAAAGRDRAERELAIASAARDVRERGTDLFAQEEITRAREEEKIARANLASADAAVVRQQAEAARAQLALAETTLAAPFDGTVAARFVEPGAVVARGDLLLRLVGGSGLWVRFAVPPGEGSALRAGLKVEVHGSSEDPVLRGVVARIAPEVDAASGMIFVEATLEASSSTDAVPARSGGTVRVTLQ